MSAPAITAIPAPSRQTGFVLAWGFCLLFYFGQYALRSAPGVEETMFLPYTQNGTDKSGVGLGLAICRRCVEANNGVLSVRSIPGSGCVFTIDLPRHALPTPV